MMFQPATGIGLKDIKHKKRASLGILRSFVKRIATSSWFNSFIMFIIGVNAIFIGFETSESIKKMHGQTFMVLDYLFLTIYTIEFIIKVYADTKGYWKSAYNIFDFVILALSFFQIIMSHLNVDDNYLGVFRLLRALRTLRTISFVEGLQVLVTALIDTIRNSVLNVVVLLALLMLFFGVVGYYSFGYDESGDRQRWGSLNTAMLTLFAFVTADGWTDIQRRLAENYPGSQWFTIAFIFLGHFIFTNLFIGIIIMNIHEATEKFLQAQRQEKEAQLCLKKEYLYKRQHEDLRQMLEKQKTSQYTNFQEMTKSFSKTLRHDDYVIMKDVCTNLLWIETYIDSLDYLDLYMYRVQQGHRNLALVLGEITERNYKQQYGLMNADHLTDGYKPFLKQEDSRNYESNEVRDINLDDTVSSFSMSETSGLSTTAPVFPPALSFSGIANKKGETLPEIANSSFPRSTITIPSIVIGNYDVRENSSSRFEDILEEDEDENVENEYSSKVKENVTTFSPVNDIGHNTDKIDNHDIETCGQSVTTVYDLLIPVKEDEDS